MRVYEGVQTSAYNMSSPLTIPSKRIHTNGDNVTALLAETRIPPRFSKTKRKSSLAESPSSFRTPVRPSRRSSLFIDGDCDSLSTLPDSYSYLLSPPTSIPDLSRSISTISMDSELSAASSQARSPRINPPVRELLDLSIEDPLLDEEAVQEPEPEEIPVRRRSSLGGLFKSVAPRVRATSFVSSLTANFSSWAASLAAAQHDDYGLIPSMSPNARGINLPRPVHAMGPTSHTTIIEAEMERVPPPYISIELKPWSPRQRTREPRLNPDFLRVLVLEQNMRKLGKLTDSFGRARMILEARCNHTSQSRLRVTM